MANERPRKGVPTSAGRASPTATKSLDPLRESARHRFSLSAFDAARLLHVAAEHHRLPWRQDGSRDAARIHANDLAPDGASQAGAPKLSGTTWPKHFHGRGTVGTGRTMLRADSFAPMG